MTRICPERDGRCPHGMDCPFTKDRYSCDMEGSRAALVSPAPPPQAQDVGELVARLEAQAEEIERQGAVIEAMEYTDGDAMHWRGLQEHVSAKLDIAEATVSAQAEEIERLTRHVAELQDKTDPDHTCACSFDRPGDVCAVHSPALVAAEATVAAQAEEIERLTRATEGRP